MTRNHTVSFRRGVNCRSADSVFFLQPDRNNRNVRWCDAAYLGRVTERRWPNDRELLSSFATQSPDLFIIEVRWNRPAQITEEFCILNGLPLDVTLIFQIRFYELPQFGWRQFADVLRKRLQTKGLRLKQ